MKNKQETLAQDQTENKTVDSNKKKIRYSTNKKFLKDLISVLEKGPISKTELAKELKLENVNSLSSNVLLAAIKLAGNSNFLNNLKENEKAGKERLNPQYVENRGLLITKWQFEGKSIADKQRYRVEFDDNTGVITLYPTDKDKAE
jgi:hypothetical protein